MKCNFGLNCILKKELRCYDLRSKSLKKRPFRPHFGPFYPHPAHKSAMRAEAATHCLAPGKPGWPPTSTWPLFARTTPHAKPAGVRSCADPPPLATACYRPPNWQRPNGTRARRAAPLFQYAPSQAISADKSTYSCPLAAAQPFHIHSWQEAPNASGSRRACRMGLRRDACLLLIPGQSGFLSDTNSQASLADGHHSRKARPHFLPGERPPGRERPFWRPGNVSGLFRRPVPLLVGMGKPVGSKPVGSDRVLD